MKKIKLYSKDEVVFISKYWGIFILFIIVNYSCRTQEFKSSNAENQKNNTTKLAKDFVYLWETGDTLKTNDIFADSCIYTDVANNQTFVGIQGVNKYIHHVHDWASNVKMTVRNIEVSEKTGYVEWKFTAKQTRPIKGIVLIATNKQITLNGVTVLSFSDNKIKDASDYMDVLGFVLQLGSKVELPGGVIINK